MENIKVKNDYETLFRKDRMSIGHLWILSQKNFHENLL